MYYHKLWWQLTPTIIPFRALINSLVMYCKWSTNTVISFENEKIAMLQRQVYTLESLVFVVGHNFKHPFTNLTPPANIQNWGVVSFTLHKTRHNESSQKLVNDRSNWWSIILPSDEKWPFWIDKRLLNAFQILIQEMWVSSFTVFTRLWMPRSTRLCASYE